ncbi:MAG: N-6 DNA methylase [Candidatus Adlerbacteria bacterium]
MNETQDDRLYTLQEVADMLHVSERTTFRYIHDKKLNAKKIGGAWRVTSADLKAFLAGEAPEVLRAVEKDMVGKRDSLTKADIKRVCDILRRDDGVGAKDYIEQFSWLLFLKVFEGVEAQLKELEEAEGRKYKSVIDAEYQWSAWAKKDWKDKDELIHFINQKLFPYLQTLQGDPRRDKIGQIFRELPGNRIRSPHNLLDVIDILNKIEKHHFQDTNLLSQVYEEILQAMGSEGGWSGEFYSPRPLIRLMVKIVNPMLGETVLDPFVGSGGFLVESFNHIYENSAKDVRAWKTLQTKTLYGQEKKPLPFLIGTMNLILHHVLVPNLVRTNTFMEDVHNTPESEKVNVILTNPPFGAEESKAVQNNYPIQVGATEGLALQYVMKRLKNGGRCGIILPEGNVLFGGGAMARIREELLTKFNVSAIISLPQGTFSQMGTGIKTNLIFFEKTGGTKEIWYGEVKGKFTKKKTVQDSDLYEVFEKWKKRENSDTSWTVPIATIKEQGYNILPKNPNTTNEMFESPDELIQALENGQSAVEKAIQSLGSLYRKLSVTSAGQRYSLTELFDRLPAGRKYSKKEVRDEGKVPVIDQSQSDVFGYHNLKPDIHASEGEPVITFANHTRAVRYMTHDFSVIQNVFPLRAKAVILPRFGYYLLQEVVPNEGYKGHWPLLEKMSFSIPDLKSQAEIVKIADAIWEHISELQKQVGKQHSDLMLFRSSFLLSIFQAEDK